MAACPASWTVTAEAQKRLLSRPSVNPHSALSKGRQGKAGTFALNSWRSRRSCIVRAQSDDSKQQEGGSNKDVSGAGLSWVSPDWLTSIVNSLRGPDTSGIPVADAKLEDVTELLGGALFLPLFKWMLESGPVYR